MTLAVEEKRVRSLFERVETVEDVAGTLAVGDERRARLLAVSDGVLADEATIRPVIAARLLGLSEKTIRAWAADGRLNDAALLDRDDLRESLEQMRRGEGRVLRPNAGSVGRQR